MSDKMKVDMSSDLNCIWTVRFESYHPRSFCFLTGPIAWYICSEISGRTFELLLGFPASPVINSVFGRLCRKTASRGREDTRVWYRETMFSQMVLYDFSLHGALHGYFLYLVSASPGKPRRRCEPEEGYLRCSKRFDHRRHFISFVIVRV